MRASRLVQRGLRYYWRSHLAVLVGVATAVAVLAGALLVGDSVRGSLAALVQNRLGRTDRVLVSTGFFRDALASAIAADGAFQRAHEAAAPLIVTPGAVTAQGSGRRVGSVRVYGVDDRFWTFHGLPAVDGPPDRQAFLSRALADELGLAAGGTVLVRVQRPTDMPLESIFGRKDDLGRTLRLDVARVLSDDELGEFSLEPTQRAVRAVFVPLSRVQQELGVSGRVNAVLVASRPGVPAGPAGIDDVVRRHVRLDDLGWRVTPLASGEGFAVESEGGILDDGQTALARGLLDGRRTQPVFTYLANTLRVGDRSIPYSLVTAMDLAAVGGVVPGRVPSAPERAVQAPEQDPPPIVLNDWAARELGARAGDRLTMEYFAWEEPGTLATRSAAFRVAGVVPIAAGDRQMAPMYPGISDAPTLDEWDPPFPVDLRRIRPADEAYWTAHRTTPKAFVPLDVGQRLWRSRYGALTSVRVGLEPSETAGAAAGAFAARLAAAADPFALGLAVRDVRADGASASQGATDFGEYFVYFSAFLVASALLLAALFFKLGVEQRVREVGLLRAVGFRPAAVRRAFLGEAVVVAAAGSALGAAGAVAYAWLVIMALGTWWVDAVGTTALRLHVAPATVAAGAAAGLATAVVCLWWTLRSLSRLSERALLAGELDAPAERAASRSERGTRLPWTVMGFGAGAIGLAALGAAGGIAPEGGFFGAGALLLATSVGAARAWLSRATRRADGLSGSHPVARLGFRGAAYRPARSVVAMAVVGAATFLLVSVDAFRRGAPGETGRASGVGGYGVLVETLLPVVHDPNGADGRYALDVTGLGPAVRFEPFRLRPGDDASCLNLYRPTNPRIVAPRAAFLDEGRFAFQGSLAESPEDLANPWRLLRREEADGAIPVIADANSMAYVLHRALGETFTIQVGGRDVALRFVAALRDSLFQGELVMGEAQFARLFPEIEGARLFLVEAPDGAAAEVAAEIRDAWVDLGAEATLTTTRLAEFHRVENTYLSTFQTLGGLGLLLGTVGLGTVLLRNVLERRKELALLSAVGYRASHLRRLVLTENAALLAGGLAAGLVAAAVAVAPAVAARGGGGPVTPRMAGILVAVFATGLLSSVVAIWAASRTPTLAALRSE